MSTLDTATLAGMASTTLFAGSMVPMLVRAARTRDLGSYSRGQLWLTNVGNAVHSIYVSSLPFGPIWLLHGFYVVVTLQMLVWHIRHVRPTGVERGRHVEHGSDPSRSADALHAGVGRGHAEGST